MAPIAALYDIHGNAPALRAVLAEVALVPDVHVLVGGDIAWGPLPEATLELVRGIGGATVIRGNADREVAELQGEEDGLDAFTAAVTLACGEAIGVEGRAYLAELPATSTHADVLFCHGSPRSDTDPITAETSAALIAEMVAGTEEAFLVLGHTHLQFRRTVAGYQLANPGSVGLPSGRPGAYWALIDDDTIEFRRTEYDLAAAAREFEARGLVGWREFADHIAAPPAIDDVVRQFTIG
jgi:predicted phosphodiesterase